MRIGTSNNAELVIECPNDYQQALIIAERMVINSQGSITIAAVQEDEFIHLCSVWDNFQRQELRDEYFAAKRDQ